MNTGITFRHYLQNKGLKATQQRDEVVNLFFKAGGRHFSVEELYQQIQKSDPQIGYATVYRTLKLLVKAGLAKECKFSDRFSRFEPVKKHEHHDHLICISCGKIVEFKEDKIEKLQNEVARKNNFRVKYHKLELYGYCKRCK